MPSDRNSVRPELLSRDWTPDDLGECLRKNLAARPEDSAVEAWAKERIWRALRRQSANSKAAVVVRMRGDTTSRAQQSGEDRVFMTQKGVRDRDA